MPNNNNKKTNNSKNKKNNTKKEYHFNLRLLNLRSEESEAIIKCFADLVKKCKDEQHKTNLKKQLEILVEKHKRNVEQKKEFNKDPNAFISKRRAERKNKPRRGGKQSGGGLSIFGFKLF